MSQDLFIVTVLLTMLIGAAFCFAGYRFFRILILLWGFFTGFSIGASLVAVIFSTGFLATAASWIIGLIVGLVLAMLAYFFYVAAVVILGATIGYWIGVGVMAAFGLGQNMLTPVAGIVVAALLAVLVIITNAPRLLMIVLTAFSGASVIVFGFLLLFGQGTIDTFKYGSIFALIHGSWLWLIAWLVLAIIGISVQSRSMSVVATQS